MARDVCVFPRSSRSAAWLVAVFERIDRAFRDIHATHDEALLKYHPHGALLEEPHPGARDPDEPDSSLYLAAHWNRAHETQTRADISRVLLSLGANMEDFDIESTSDAE